MGGVGGTPAIAEDENVAAFLERPAQLLDNLRDGVHRNGIMRGFLGLDVFGDPLLHPSDYREACIACQEDSCRQFSGRRGFPPDSASKTIGIDGVKYSTGDLSVRRRMAVEPLQNPSGQPGRQNLAAGDL